MSIIVLRLPDVKRKTEERPQKCPYCGGETFQGWGGVSKAVKDSRHRRVRVHRYRCCHCRRTFRHYPQGVDRATQTLRLRKLTALCWVLGLSLRGVCAVFAAFGVSISHMTVWRDVQEQARQQQKRRHWRPVRVLGVDGAYPLGWGKKQPVLIAVDIGRGDPVAVGYVDEHDPRAVERFLKPLVQRLGVSVIVSDDLHSIRTAANKLAVEHQVCQFHVRRWVGRTIKHLRDTLPEEWLWVMDETQRLIDELPVDGDRQLFDLWKQVAVPRKGTGHPLTPVDRLRLLLIRLSENWHHYRVFDWQPEVPWTNNITEQTIGRMKMRSRTVRGFKSRQGMWAGLLLAGLGASW
ncbi:MAG: transposase [Anaerolineales bacterium]|jgi:transposase-like protein